MLTGWLACTVAASVAAAGDPTRAASGSAASASAQDRDGAFQQVRLAREGPGVELGDAEGRWFVNAWVRTQFRYSDPFDQDPMNPADFDAARGAEVELRRGRIKVDGHLFDPAIGFYVEHELSGDRPLLDLRLDLEIGGSVRMRVGQYKVLYNRERVDSSGKQQFAERSIVNRPFTVDRQRGVTVDMQIAPGSRLDSRLMLGMFQGDGRDPEQRGDDPMLVARWQWHVLGEPLPFSQSDLAFRDKAAASLAFAGSRVRGPHTRFSSSGGGQLDGFLPGGDDRYTLEQWLQESAWQFAGMSWQQEFHHKRIRDHETGMDSRLRGGYAQFGKAWPVRLAGRTRPVELALRGARVEWLDTPNDRVQKELTVAANLFWDGHDNKLTLDVSRLEVDDLNGAERDTRVRLQWDVSF